MVKSNSTFFSLFVCLSMWKDVLVCVGMFEMVHIYKEQMEQEGTLTKWLV